MLAFLVSSEMGLIFVESFADEMNDNGLSQFAVRSDFCVTEKGDNYLGLHNKSRHNIMYKHSGGNCKYLPFARYNHTIIKRNIIYRQLPVDVTYTFIVFVILCEFQSC